MGPVKRTAFVTALLITLTLIVGAPPAEAATCAAGQTSSCTSWIDSPGPASVRTCITGLTTTCQASTTKGPLAAGTAVTMLCYAFGDLTTGKYSSDKWFWSTVASGPKAGSTGWVHSSWVVYQRKVGRCSGEVPALGTNNYDGRTAPCARSTYVSGGVTYCLNADFRGSNGSLNSARDYGWRNCTDFAAFRMKVPAGWGNAIAWDVSARKDLSHWAIDARPHVGDIAQSDAGTFGHVAVVSSTRSGEVLLEEYNQGAVYPGKVYYGDGRYRNSRWVSTSGWEFIRRIR